jgi:hypothetical protein
MWAIANYLLAKNRCTYMYMSGSQQYGSLVIFPEYSIPIGHPEGPMRRMQKVWGREYSGGLALVNPYRKAAIVALPPGSYVDMNGNPIGPTLMMERQTGQVLLSAQ